MKGILNFISQRGKPPPPADAPPSLSKEQVQQLIDASVEAKGAEFERLIDERVSRALSQRLFKPRLPAMNNDGAPFMAYSNCCAADMLHPRYRELCSVLMSPPVLHRKLWEWVFVIHHLFAEGVVAPGKKGIGFGVGKESLPALFAGLGAFITATDAPLEANAAGNWIDTGQHSASRNSLRYPPLCPDDQFDERVVFRFCDMNAIDMDLTGFDFTWSSCCFEHLGSIEAGIQFVINSVETCLKPGGIAVHTTELNVSSDENTLSIGPTVIYRRRDIIDLIERLRARGHDAMPFNPAPDAHVLDFHVDVPPYTHDPHIKLSLGDYVSTSVGIVVRRSLS